MARKSPPWKPNPMQDSVLKPYGIDYDRDPETWEVKFGSQLLYLDNQLDAHTNPDGRYLPTTERLINHVGLLEDIRNDSEYFALLQSRQNLWNEHVSMAGIKLERKVLTPCRKQLEKRWHFTFYRLSNNLQFQTNPKTGLVSLHPIGTPVLKVTPLSTEVALGRGIKERYLQYHAPDALFVLEKRKVAYRTIFCEDQLLSFIDGWLRYLPDQNPKIREHYYHTFKLKVPHAVGDRVTQLLLWGVTR